jgi:phage tail sheath protein FI
MAQRTITSPGVEIRESDLSLIAPQNIGTNFYITGFAQQGPLDEVLKITTRQELDQVFGTPTTSAERYFYYSISELLNSPGNVYASRLPYGADSGDGFGSQYSALAYPVTAADFAGGKGSLTFSGSGVYVLGAPTHVNLTEAEYLSALEGTAFDWTATGSTKNDLSTVSNLGKAGLIVLNKAQTTINEQFEGYYIGAVDNTNLNPATDFNGIIDVKSVASNTKFLSGAAYTTLPSGTLQFSVSAPAQNGAANSVSEVMENLTPYNIDGREDDDVLNLGVFKIRKSIYANEAFKLDYVLEEGLVGSVNYNRTQLNPNGGPNNPFYIGVADSNSRNVEVLINDNLSNRLNGGDGLNADGSTTKKVRFNSAALRSLAVTDINTVGVTQTFLTAANTQGGDADSLFALGAYSDTAVDDKVLGDIPTKVDRALEGISNDEIYDIDVVVEGGLGTIHAASDAAGTTYYDEYNTNAALTTAVNGLRKSSDITGTARTLRNNYSTIFNKFEKFCSPPYLGGGRGDCIFVADVLRQILVTGEKTRVLDNKARNFQTDVYWPIRHQFENENTSYAAVYAQWPLVYDSYSGRQVFIPFSGFAGAAMARTDAANFPWFAPAGFTRGLIQFANDLAVNPNQKQRDELYKANINPVANFPNQGQVIFGQKTLSKKPSAFDRINVRRLFLALERPTKKASRFFVFEQNTEFTRQRLINTLTPLFERAKNNEGIYDYLIVCDERNNTPEVIDANELVVDIYIKPVRTAEFILVNFYATRTDANFEEIIG